MMVDVVKTSESSGDARPQWWEAPLDGFIKRERTDDGGEWITVQTVTGGSVMIYTSCPLVFIDPETH